MNPTVRQQQEDAPEAMPPARAVAAREAARRGGQARDNVGPPSMQPGQPPQFVSSETLDQLTHLLTQRIEQGDLQVTERLSRRLSALEEAGEPRAFTGRDLELRLEALTEARAYVARHVRASQATLDLDTRLGLELEVAKFLLDQE
jgi:hypothetical protein